MRVPSVRIAREALSAARERRRRRTTASARLVHSFAELYPEAFFIEIGANDGLHHDHLRDAVQNGAWSGIMVEPVPYVFERLRQNFGRYERIALENVAIADRDGTLPFYHLAETDEAERGTMPGWYDGIGSFSREVVVGHGRHIPDIEARLVCTQVPCMTFESLCRKHNVREIDLVVIDTEGYDYRLIQTIDLTVRAPRMLIYEHYHLSPGDRRACRRHLESEGFETLGEGFDTFCLDTRVEDRLTETWRRVSAAIPPLSVHDEPG